MFKQDILIKTGSGSMGTFRVINYFSFIIVEIIEYLYSFLFIFFFIIVLLASLLILTVFNMYVMLIIRFLTLSGVWINGFCFFSQM